MVFPFAPRFRIFPAVVLSIAVLGVCMPGHGFSQDAGTQSFKDVSPTHPTFAAVEYLRGRGIIQGNPDGTFRPDDTVTRAAAVKMLVAAQVSSEEIAAVTSTSYSDIAAGVWYLPYVELARTKLAIIDGPPAKTQFRGSAPVQKAEFIKMALLSKKIDARTAFSDLAAPLAADTVNAEEWFYPFMRYALASSMIFVTSNGNLEPGKELSRGEVALLLFHLDMYRAGRRTQALLALTEGEIVNLLALLDAKTVAQAKFAAARSILTARGALESRPDEVIVKGAVKTAEGFGFLVQGYEAGIRGEFDAVIAFAKEAWAAGDKARAFSPALGSVTQQIQTIAGNMANEARAAQAKQ